MKRPTPTHPMIGYVRASDWDQEAGAQTAKLTAYFQQNSVKPAQIHRDDEAGKSLPGRDAAVNQACESQGTLVVSSLTDLAGSFIDCIHIVDRLRRAQSHLVCVADGIDSRGGSSFFDVTAALERLEHNHISDRLPYGYEIADDLVHVAANAQQQHVIARILRWHYDGQGTAQIAKALNEAQLLSRHGAPWTAGKVQTVLDQNPTSRWGSGDGEKD